MPDEPVVETPPETTEPVVTPEVVETTEPEVTVEAPDWDAKVKEWGGEEAVAEALQFKQYLNTEDGATDYFVEAGLALGLTPAQLEGFFNAKAAGEEDPDEAEARLDEPMTRREFEAALREQVFQPLSERETEAQLATVADVVRSEVERLEIEPKVVKLVLGLADEHLTNPADQLDPAKVRAAIALGLEEFEAIQKVNVKRAKDAKVEQRSKLPTPLRGGSPGGEEAPEAQNVEEAKLRVRAALRAQGAIE